MSNTQSNWIFNSRSIEGNYGYIHFPLLYLTKNKLSLQIYADSIPRFFELNGLDIYINTIDYGVTEFLVNSLTKIQNSSINNINDMDFSNKIINILNNIYSNYPKLCLEMETSILNNKKVTYKIFKELYDYTVSLLAISHFNPLLTKGLEAILENTENSSLVDEYLYKDNFSHIIYFNNEFNALKKSPTKQNIINFGWNVGFSKDTIGDGCEFEDYNYLQSLLETTFDFKKNDKPDNLYYPNIKLGNIDIDNNTKHTLQWGKMQQSSLEFRHYWGLRFLRDAKLLLTDKKYSYIWTLDDYEKKYFKIK